MLPYPVRILRLTALSWRACHSRRVLFVPSPTGSLRIVMIGQHVTKAGNEALDVHIDRQCTACSVLHLIFGATSTWPMPREQQTLARLH